MEEAVAVGYVFLGAIPIRIFSLSDTCRTGAIEGIKELKSMGIKTAMLTGDSAIATKNAQKQLGNALEVIHTQLLPEDKVRIVHFPREGFGQRPLPSEMGSVHFPREGFGRASYFRNLQVVDWDNSLVPVTGIRLLVTTRVVMAFGKVLTACGRIISTTVDLEEA